MVKAFTPRGVEVNFYTLWCNGQHCKEYPIKVCKKYSNLKLNCNIQMGVYKTEVRWARWATCKRLRSVKATWVVFWMSIWEFLKHVQLYILELWCHRQWDLWEDFQRERGKYTLAACKSPSILSPEIQIMCTREYTWKKNKKELRCTFAVITVYSSTNSAK